MQTYITLLRGINVSGQKKIIMAEFRTLLGKIGLENVQTYIQSGNIIFRHEQPAEALTTSIHQAILNEYGFDVPITIFSPHFLTQVIHNNPFLRKEPSQDIKKLAVAFLSEKPSDAQVKILEEKYMGDDEFALSGKVVYLLYKNGAGRSKLSNNYLEKQLKVSATSRNWKTTLKLKSMCI